MSADRSGKPVKIQCSRIHAIAFAGWRGAVIEDVAKMGSAPGAQDFGALHPAGSIDTGPDVKRGYRSGEARPAGTGIEFIL